MLRKVFDKITSRGWNLYCAEDGERIYDVVSRGPASELQMHKTYVFFSRTSSPRNVDVVRTDMQRMLKNGIFPHIDYQGRKLSLAIIELFNDYILIKERQDIQIHYRDFLNALDTLPDISSETI